jgi:hypothetical protein
VKEIRKISMSSSENNWLGFMAKRKTHVRHTRESGYPEAEVAE